MISRRLLPLAALVGLLVAGCSGAPGEETAPAATRSFTHAHGTTEIPARPARIVVLEPVQLDSTVALGAIPVGAAVLSEAAGVPAYLRPDADAVETVGTVQTPNLEKIAALRPDLVIGTESRHADLYDRLSAIAPTVFMGNQADPWQDNVRFVGRALGREADAEALLGEYTEQCGAVARRFGTEGRTAQLVRPRDGQLTLYGPESFAGSTLECAGFTTPPRDWEDSISVDLSPELVLEARADLVLVTAADPANPNAVPPVMSDVRAQSFPNLHVVDQSFWITGVGPRGGRAVLDDLSRILAG